MLFSSLALLTGQNIHIESAIHCAKTSACLMLLEANLSTLSRKIHSKLKRVNRGPLGRDQMHNLVNKCKKPLKVGC